MLVIYASNYVTFVKTKRQSGCHSTIQETAANHSITREDVCQIASSAVFGGSFIIMKFELRHQLVFKSSNADEDEDDHRTLPGKHARRSIVGKVLKDVDVWFSH